MTNKEEQLLRLLNDLSLHILDNVKDPNLRKELGWYVAKMTQVLAQN